MFSLNFLDLNTEPRCKCPTNDLIKRSGDKKLLKNKI